jgi:hypothetical protein
MIDFGIAAISPAELLRRFEAHVQENAGLSRDRCFLSLIPPAVHLLSPPADDFITIFPTAFPVWQGVVTGAGAALGGPSDLGFDGLVTVHSYNRVAFDQEFRSPAQLSSDTLGVMRRVMDLVAAVQFWTCPDPDDPTTSPLREPARLADPGIRVEPKNVKTGTWAVVSTAWSVRFTAMV